MIALSFVNRWLCEQLVRELLVGAWRFVLARRGRAQDLAFARFTRLVESTSVWPCYVSFVHPREMDRRARRGLVVWPCLQILTDEQIDADAGEAY